MNTNRLLTLTVAACLVAACSTPAAEDGRPPEKMESEPASSDANNTVIESQPAGIGSIIVDSGDEALLGDLFLVRADGSGSEKFLDSEDNGYQHFGYADWSADGSEIVFSALKAPWEILTANADGSNLQAVPNTIGGQYPAWSPDGRKIAFSAWQEEADIFVINRDGSELTNLTENFSLNALDPSWSPDGRQLAFQAAKSGEDYELFTIMVDGLFTAQLTDNGQGDWSAEWSPTGNEIAYLHSTESDYTEVRVIDLDTGNISQRTTAFGYPALSADPGLCWMSDGERLVIVSGGELFITRYDGGVIFDKIWDGSTFTSFPSCP